MSVIYPTDVNHEAYRAFRASIIEKLDLKGACTGAWTVNQPHPPRQLLREQIEAFRNHLLYSGEILLVEQPDIEPVFRYSLRIPNEIKLLPRKREKFFQHLVPLLPPYVQRRRVRKLLEHVRTYHGRQFVFNQQIKRTIVGQNFLTDSLDFALRFLNSPNSQEEIRRITYTDLNWIKACYFLGVRDIEKVCNLTKNKNSCDDSGRLVFAMVRLGIIKTSGMLTTIPTCSSDHYMEKLTAIDMMRFKQTIQLLQHAGVDPSLILSIVLFRVKQFDPIRLKSTLTVLNLSHNELSLLFEYLGKELLLVPTDRWDFLRNTLNISSVKEIRGFKTLLTSSSPLNKDFALALLKAGADSHELKVCQELILLITKSKTAFCIANLELLIAPPYRLHISQLAQATNYFMNLEDLASFLQVLDKHGYCQALSVLEFQCCYPQLNAERLDDWLSIVGELGKGHSVDIVAEWIHKAASGGYSCAFLYLKKANLISSLENLQKAIKIAPLGETLLRFLVEEQEFKTVSDILSWYYNRAPGVKEIWLSGKLNPIERVLLEDAFRRENFKLFEDNRKCVNQFISKRVEAPIGGLPYKADGAEEDSRLMLLENELAPKLKALLAETNGVLLDCIIMHIHEPLSRIREIITHLHLHLDKLLDGGGPVNAELTELEADLIALVYRTTSQTVVKLWPHVLGQEKDIAHLVPPLCYSMYWNPTRWLLKRPLDQRGISSLARAAKFTENYVGHSSKNMHIACKNLSPKRLHDAAADVWSLAEHLGLLLVIAKSSPIIQESVSQWSSSILMSKDDSQLYQIIESIHALFLVNLNDTLNEFEDDFINSLSDEDAQFLVSRLTQAEKSDISAKDNLRRAVALTRKITSKVYLRWVDQQKKCFNQNSHKSLSDRVKLKAIISKSPSAFFAKEAAGICTSWNINMWKEPRHAHLLVFNPNDKQLAAMGLLYFESIQAVSRDKPTLVMRAINPLPGTLGMYSASSIVDGFFEVAKNIAQNNDLAAVAFPAPSGMHLMSNHDDIEKDIQKRFMKQSREFMGGFCNDETGNIELPHMIKGTFYAYESGVQPVDNLYVIWLSTPK